MPLLKRSIEVIYLRSICMGAKDSVTPEADQYNFFKENMIFIKGLMTLCRIFLRNS